MIKLTDYFLKHPKIANMIVALLFLMGIFFAHNSQRELLPSFSFDIIRISTHYPGAAPEDVELNVTKKIEDQLMEVENIRKLTSLSMENISIIQKGDIALKKINYAVVGKSSNAY